MVEKNKPICETDAGLNSLKTFFDNSRDLIFISELCKGNIFGRFIEVNETTCKKLGYTRRELLKLSLREITTRDFDRNKTITRDINKDKNAYFETNVLTRRGQEIPVEVNSHIREHGDKQFIVSIARDTSECAGRKKEVERIIDCIDVPILTINKEHKITHWNTAMESLTGIKRGDVINTDKQYITFYPKKRPILADMIVSKSTDDEIKKIYPDYNKSRLIENAFEGFNHFKSLNKNEKWMHFTAAPLRDSDKNLIGAIETAQDLSELKKLEYEIKAARDELEKRVKERTAELAKANRKLKDEIRERMKAQEEMLMPRGAIEKMSTALVITDIDTRIIYVNPAFLELGGYSRIDEIIGRKSHEFVSNQGCEKLDNEVIPELMLHGKWKGELIVKRKNGEEYPIEMNCSLVCDRKGHPCHLLSNFQDITERKLMERKINDVREELETRVHERTRELAETNERLHAEIMERKKVENALKESERQLLDIIDWLPDPTFVINKRGEVIAWNRAIENITNVKAKDILGKNNYEYSLAFYGERRPILIDLVLKPDTIIEENYEYTKREDSTLIGEAYMPMLQEGKTYLSGNATALYDSRGNITGAIESIRDVTEGKKAEEQIKKSLHEKEILLKEIHHRVKNNLQVISSLLNLQADYIQDMKTQRMFKESQNRIRSIALVHEKLYQSKDLTMIDFAEYVKKLTNFLLRSYGNTQNIHMEIEMEDIYMDINKATPCSLIINELVSNCLKHAFPPHQTSKGLVQIVMKREGDMNALTVKDNGVGFPVEAGIDGDKSLGLQLVSTLVDQLKGTIELKREKGTTFIIKFSNLD